jgi:adenosine deaminase
MSINTDGRTISDVTLSEEYEKVTETFGWSIGDFLKCNLEAMDYAFASPETRERIKKRILNAYDGLVD